MISKPNVNISLASANNVLNIGDRRNLIICQTPGATAHTLVQDIPDLTKTQLDSLLGAGSYARIMVQQWLDANRTGNDYGAKLDMITLLDGAAATAATKVITLGATEAATAAVASDIEISILSSELYNKTISVAVGDTSSEVAAAIVAAYASTTAPFTLAAGTTPNEHVITVTATDLGTIGNDYGIEITGVPSAIDAVITSGVTGAGPPINLDTITDLLGETVRYQGILWPSDLSGDVDEVTDFLDARFNVSNDILDGVAFMGDSNTLTLEKALANLHNSPSLVIAGNAITVGSSTKIGPEVVHPVDWTTATFMGIRARRLTDNASIASVVTANASNDQFGGQALASLPYFNTPIASVPVTGSVNLFDSSEQVELNAAGYTVIGPNKPITETITGAMVTTYKTDPAGNPDISFSYLNYVDTSSVCREFFFVNFKSIFAQSRLTDGNLIAGRSMENEASLKAVFKRLLQVLKDNTLIRDGSVADALVEDSLTVVIDLANRKATINSVLPIVTQLETINSTLQLTFEL